MPDFDENTIGHNEISEESKSVSYILFFVILFQGISVKKHEKSTNIVLQCLKFIMDSS